MTKRIYILGLACILLAKPFSFALAQESTAPDSVSMTLAAIYQLADEKSRVIRISEQSLRAAQEGVQQAKNSLLPSVSIDLSGSYIGDAYLMSRGFSTSGTTEVILPGLGPQTVNNGRQQTPHWGNMLSVKATQVIYSGGALTAGIKIAEAGERIAELDVRKSRQEVRFLLTGIYLDQVRLMHQLEVIDVHIDLTEQVLAQMRANQPENQVILPDTAAVAQEFARLENALSEAAWQSSAADHNLSIQQAQAATDIAAQKVKLTRAASIPKIAAVIKDDLFGPYTNDLIPVNANVNAWFVGIGIHYDLDSAWKNHRAIKQSKAENLRSKEELELAQEQLNNRVHAAYVNFLTSFTEVETQLKQVELADENYDTVEKRYNHELALLTDLLDASSMKLQANIALVNARVNLLYNYYQLKYTTHSL